MKNLNKSYLHSILNESIRNILNESQESKSPSEAIKLVMSKLRYDYNKANSFVRNDLRNDITSLRDKKLAKFTLGVTRMYCDGQIRDERTINDLNETLKLLSAHLDEYDRNLNGISANDLIQRFAQTRRDNIEQEKNDINNMSFGETDYDIVRIDSFEEAKKYYVYTNPNSRWCVTYMEDMFDSYSSNGMNQIYFCLKNGFENVPCEVGANAPLDEYGLSMLSIIVNENGELAYCTTRWNHDNGGSYSSMSAKEVSEVVGVNFYEVFKPNGKWNELLRSVHERLQNGESPSDIFDYVGSFSEGFAVVQLNGKYNFITTEGELLSKQWFDSIWGFNEGFAAVQLNNKWNYISTEGKLISKQWFDDADFYIEGFAQVKLNGNYYYIDKNGNLSLRESINNILLNKIISECIDNFITETINDNKYLYHATPSCYVNSIKKYGLGGKIPKKRFWDYVGTPYENITQGVFLATDEYVAESYLEASEDFEELSENYEARYGKELGIVVFKININDLDESLLSIDENQILDDNIDPTYFYNGVIPFNKLNIIKLY